MHQRIKTELLQTANSEKAKVLASFFKTGKGQYGDGDVFIGVPIPVIRTICKTFTEQIRLNDIKLLLTDPIHEVRMAGVILLVSQFAQSDATGQKAICEFYLAHTANINNWDLVDCSAYQILGSYLFDKPRDILYKLAGSVSLWEQRIAIVATFYFIKRQQFADTFAIAELFLSHRHDLIHKATGWMLREVGKQNQPALEVFLNQHGTMMPRTMLRYAIERFPPDLRQHYLKLRADQLEQKQIF